MTRLLLAAVLALTAASTAAQDDEGVEARLGKFAVEKGGRFTRLVYDDNNLVGSQINAPYLEKLDVPNLLAPGTQWEALALVGAHVRWDPRLEPLNHYHRSGPVGAVFYHLRTRNRGADAAAPVGVVGMAAGAPAAYAVRGQTMTFYSAHEEPRDLVATTGRYFTFVPDARKRGAELEFRYGPVRRTLAADADKRFALLLVDLVEDDFDPGDRLTLEAVRLYVDRTRPDGVVALHTTNRRFNLEPVVDRIASELKLAARVWYDEAGSRTGKAASTWVVLARSEADLGPLARPTAEQVVAFGDRSEPLRFLLAKYGPDKNAVEAILAEWGGPEADRQKLTPALLAARHGPQVSLLYRHYTARIREPGHAGRDATLGALAWHMVGDMFRPLVADLGVDLHTDDHRPALPPPPPRR